MKKKTEKLKVNDDNIQLIVDLLITEEVANKIMALGIAINMDWNVKSTRHVTIMEILWYAYFGSFFKKQEPGYELEYEIGKKICKPMGIIKWKEDDKIRLNYTTPNIIPKAARFFNKFGVKNPEFLSHKQKAISMFSI